MARVDLSKYDPIVIKFSGYLPLDWDTIASDFGPVWLVRLAVQEPKVGHNESDCCVILCNQNLIDVCVSRTAKVLPRNVLFNNLVLAFPKMEQLSESGTLPKCKIVLVKRYFAILIYVKKTWCKIIWCSQNVTYSRNRL